MINYLKNPDSMTDGANTIVDALLSSKLLDELLPSLQSQTKSALVSAICVFFFFDVFKDFFVTYQGKFIWEYHYSLTNSVIYKCMKT